jgi:hypothetical protein
MTSIVTSVPLIRSLLSNNVIQTLKNFQSTENMFNIANCENINITNSGVNVRKTFYRLRFQGEALQLLQCFHDIT